MLPENGQLSARQLECLALAAQGQTSKETARQLQLSERTVNFHIQVALRKLGVRNKLAAVARAQAMGLLTIPASALGNASMPSPASLEPLSGMVSLNDSASSG